MKRVTMLALGVAAVLAVASAAMAASSPPTSPTLSVTPAPAAFTVQAKVLQVGNGWVQVQILKVKKGTGLQVNANLRILATAKTKFLQAGKVASLKDLKMGETVQIVGSSIRRGKALTYQGTSFTIIG